MPLQAQPTPDLIAPFEGAARIYCAKAGFDPDQEVSVPHPFFPDVMTVVPLWYGPAGNGPIHRKVRPVIEAYKDHCGVRDDRFDTCTDDEMRGTPNIAAAAFRGYAEYRAGWDAALSMLSAEVERLTWALDHGGNKYRRPAEIDRLMPLIQQMRA